MNLKGQLSLLRYGLATVLALPLVLAAVKIVQLLLFFDEDTGMLSPGGGAAVLQWILGIGGAAVLGLGVWMTLVLREAGGYYLPGPTLADGLGQFLAGLCFLGQSVADLLLIMDNRRLKIGGPTGDIAWIQVAVSAAGLLLAGLLIAMAYRTIAAGKRPPALVSTLPAVWCALFMMSLLYTHENTVSLQDNAAKTLAGVLGMLCCYYLGRSLCGLDGRTEPAAGLWFRLVFPGIGFLCSAPYCAAYLAGVGDRAGNMPYLALTGLSLWAGIAAVQLCRGGFAGLRRRALHSRITPPEN